MIQSYIRGEKSELGLRKLNMDVKSTKLDFSLNI